VTLLSLKGGKKTNKGGKKKKRGKGGKRKRREAAPLSGGGVNECVGAGSRAPAYF